uniref:Transposon Ty3-G Gag-Pol polyprotein n=1 Tax=Cajanus cajan TaxID=3821 RepID=A0A151T9K9_CAJCA|nr:Transposon Ty3-G Gag-Pol polyprotein [Cajanus cajan]
MDKDVVPWFQMMQKTSPFRSWVSFTHALELEFGPSPFDCPRSTLFKLTQSGSVGDYYLEFTALANRVTGVTVDALLDCFISGLKADIRRDVITQNPNSLLKAVSLAKLFEEKHTSTIKPYSHSTYNRNLNTNPKTNTLPALLPTPNQKPSTQTGVPTNVKKISLAEMQLRRDKGLCYTCNDKFTPSHRCPNKQYLLLHFDELDDPPDSITEAVTDNALEHHLSYHALKGSSGVGTMRFQGSINGVTVQILLDSGSSDNFLQPRIAHYLNLPIEPIPSFQVLVGNGNALEVEGLVRDVTVSVQNHKLRIPVYLLPIAGADLVLGASWLATLGPHVSDYSALTLKFYLGSDFVTLKGEKATLPTQAQFHHIRRLCNTHAIAEFFSIQFQSLDVPQDVGLELPDHIHPDLALLLFTYRTVFDKPTGRFIKSYASIAAPLTNLLKKGCFQWDSHASTAFQQLKEAITQAPILALPDFAKPFILETDASGTGIDQIIQTPEQQAWLHKFLGYDFSIEYKPGKDNVGADALSRSFFMAMSQPTWDIISLLKAAIASDSKYNEILQACNQGNPPHQNYSAQDQLLYWKHRLVIPPKHPLIKQVLHEFHNSPIGGHAGTARTLARISAQFFWKGMSRDIKNHVQQCLLCQQAKTSTTLPAGLLQPLSIPVQIWEDLAMDFIVGLPPSHGFTVILVVVDRLSKYAHFATLKTDYTSTQVAEVFMKNIVKLHGLPKSIVSDRDRVFTSKFWQQLFKLSGTTLAMSSAYHPQSDGQSEALNKCLEMYLRCFTVDNPREWSKLLPWAEFWYNSSFQSSINMTPFRAVYGRDPPTIVKYQLDSTDPPSLQELLLQRDVTLNQLKTHLVKAQQRMKKFADKKRIPLEFDIGELVLVKLQPYRQHSVALRKHQKLGLRYFGPFPIIKKIGSVAYKLLLPASAKIHSVFHVSLLKKCKGNHQTPYLPLPLLTNEFGPVVQPSRILDSRTIIRGDQHIAQVLIQWDGLDATQATWEDATVIHKDYPNFYLEDKVDFYGGGNVTRVEESLDKESQEKDDWVTNEHGETVIQNIQVAKNEEIKAGRKSERTRKPNQMLKEFVW